MCLSHLTQGEESYDLYRIFYYDCLPYEKGQRNPLTGESIDFAKTEVYKFKVDLLEALKEKRKVAVRLGVLAEKNGWVIRPGKTQALLNGKLAIGDLTGEDIQFDLRQKQVDMKIGLDIASMALKNQVEQIVLVSGDSDFVPAAKLARRAGVDFLLDPMWNPIKPQLFEHIDGLRSRIKRPDSN